MISISTSKILHFDLETTGLGESEHSIIQLAGLIEIDKTIVERFDYRIKPDRFDNISPSSIETHGVSIEEMKTFQPSSEVYESFKKLLSKHCNPYDRNDKYIPAGYRVDFDLSFLTKFFENNGDKYLGSFLDWRRTLDPLPILRAMDFNGIISLSDYKLETVCKAFGIKLNAHEAMSDIIASRELLYKVLKHIV